MDFGDAIFFLVFVGIIISNIVKQIKKARQKEQGRVPGQQKAGKPGPVKKSGWKDVLAQMLEEAQRQTEAPAGGEPKQPSEKAATGWETIIDQPDALSHRLEVKPEPKPEKPRVSRRPKPPLIPEASRQSREEVLELKRMGAVHPSEIPPETKIKYKAGADAPAGRERVVTVQATAMVAKIPRALSLEGLQSAVVWAEILGPPRALKDLEY